MVGKNLCRQMKPMNGVKEEEGPNALVKIPAGSPERVQRRAFAQQFVTREGCTSGIKRLITESRIGSGNDAGQSLHGDSGG
jgi:hypothetical protein